MKSYSGSRLDILIDQGKDDQFLSAGQLLPDNFIAACTERKIPVVFRLQQASCFCSPWWLDSCLWFCFYARGSGGGVCKGAGMPSLWLCPWPPEEESEKCDFPVAWAITGLIQPHFTTRCRRASSLDRLIPAWGLGLPVLG